MSPEAFLARLSGVRRNGTGWKALCPAHADRNPSLSVTAQKGKFCCSATLDARWKPSAQPSASACVNCSGRTATTATEIKIQNGANRGRTVVRAASHCGVRLLRRSEHTSVSGGPFRAN